MAPKVLKIPDGNGGMTFQIQTPDGAWHLADENGIILSKDETKEASTAGMEAIRKDREYKEFLKRNTLEMD